MLGQLNMAGLDKVQAAIKRLQTFEPAEGYYLAFSGGKDSIVVKALADMAGVKYDAHYSLTTVDPPELIYYMREHHKDVQVHKPKKTMWQLIAGRKMPPTRMIRYCCDELKEIGGYGRFVITGVRWAESSRRKNSRAGLEINAYTKDIIKADPDNPENEKMARFCPSKGKHIINPIIDWEDTDVWEFIKVYELPYCSLYDEGFKRIGCIGCPLSANAKEELGRYPKYKRAYLRAFEKMLQNIPDEKTWKTPEDVMKWWISDKE